MLNRRRCAIVLGAVVITGGLLGGCRRNRPQPPATAPRPDGPDDTITTELTGGRWRLEDATGPVYDVKSNATTQTQATTEATLTNTTVTLFHKGQPDVIVASPNTRVDEKTRELVMWGGVTAKAPHRRATFRVERLTWNIDTKLYRGTGGVKFAQPPLTMTAQRITGRTPVKTVNLEGGVALDVVPSTARR